MGGGTVVCVTISRCTSCILDIPEGEGKEEEIIFWRNNGQKSSLSGKNYKPTDQEVQQIPRRINTTLHQSRLYSKCKKKWVTENFKVTRENRNSVHKRINIKTWQLPYRQKQYKQHNKMTSLQCWKKKKLSMKISFKNEGKIKFFKETEGERIHCQQIEVKKCWRKFFRLNKNNARWKHWSYIKEWNVPGIVTILANIKYFSNTWF